MNNKKFSVKGIVFNEVKQDASNLKYGEVKVYRGKLTLLARGLSFEQAKKIRRDNSSIMASVFPDCPEPELKIIKLN